MDHALWFVAPGQVERRPCTVAVLGPTDVCVRTGFSGISAGTELLAYRGLLPPDLPIDDTLGSLGGTFTYPFRYGYSCVGRVESIGAGVRGLRTGDVVFAFHPHQTRFVVDAAEAVVIAQLEPRLATLLPFVETALQVTLDAGDVFGEVVVVTGIGVLGVLVATLLQRAGADVVALDPQAWRCRLAGDLGIRAVAPGDARQFLDRIGRAGGVPLVIEASGNPVALTDSLALLAHEGTALVASWYGCQPVTLPLGEAFHRRRLTIRSTQVSTIPARLTHRWSRDRRLAHAVALCATLPLAALATDTVDFTDAPTAYARLAAGRAGLMHAALGYG